MTQLLEKIRSRGHWSVVIRPATFLAERIPRQADLVPLIRSSVVQLRGWDFPHIDSKAPPHRDLDWIGQESEWGQFLEIWRIYQSGQFADLSGMLEDWLDQDWRDQLSGRQGVPDDWKPGRRLGVFEAVFRFIEIFEFAARLALTAAGDDFMHIEVALRGLSGRQLWMDDPARGPIWSGQPAAIPELPYQVDISRSELIGNPRELAIEPTLRLFDRFGWDVTEATIRSLQADLKGH